MSALVRWLPQIARASADDIARYGPEAARVRTLLDFISTMSQDAASINAVKGALPHKPFDAAILAAWDNKRIDARRNAMNAADAAIKGVAGNANIAYYPAWGAAAAEVVNDLITPDAYRALTNPLAAGRAFDVLRPRSPENFRDVVRKIGERDAIRQPLDVLTARTIARSPQEIRDIALGLIETGMGVDEALQTARTMAI